MRARRRAVVSQAQGRVLDLGGADTHQQLWDRRAGDTHAAPVEVTVLSGVEDPRFRDLVADGERFDTIVSILQLASTRDLAASIEALGRLLTDTGELLFVEPGAQTGLAGRVQRLTALSATPFLPWRVDRDVPASLRSQGLSVIRVQRHRVPTMQWWLRSLVEGAAHRALPVHTDRAAPGAPPAGTEH